MNRTAFFAAIRNSLFGGKLNQAQVELATSPGAGDTRS